MARFYTRPSPKAWAAEVGDEWPPEIREEVKALLTVLNAHFEGRPPPDITLQVSRDKAGQVAGWTLTLSMTE